MPVETEVLSGALWYWGSLKARMCFGMLTGTTYGHSPFCQFHKFLRNAGFYLEVTLEFGEVEFPLNLKIYTELGLATYTMSPWIIKPDEDKVRVRCACVCVCTWCVCVRVCVYMMCIYIHIRRHMHVQVCACVPVCPCMHGSTMCMCARDVCTWWVCIHVSAHAFAFMYAHMWAYVTYVRVCVCMWRVSGVEDTHVWKSEKTPYIFMWILNGTQV